MPREPSGRSALSFHLRCSLGGKKCPSLAASLQLRSGNIAFQSRWLDSCIHKRFPVPSLSLSLSLSVMEEETKLIEGEGSGSKGAAVDVDNSGKNGNGEVVIDVDDSWVKSMKEKLASKYCKPFPQFTIFRVSEDIRKIDNDAYTPWIVSIGPFHRQRTNLQAMEEHKWHYLHKVLDRSGNDLNKYLKEMKAIEPQVRNCYSGEIKMEVNEFVEMMVLDGCFILQLLLRKKKKAAEDNDPIDSTNWMFARIVHDMLLLENQLPFLVLETLCRLITVEPRTRLRKKALSFFKSPLQLDLKCPPEASDVHHLLHLVHLSIKPTSPPRDSHSKGGTAQPSKRQWFSFQSGQQSSPKSENKQAPRRLVISSATQLHEAGVKFQRMNDGNFMDVEFEDGKMKMPRLSIHDFTCSIFRNLVAFEKYLPGCGTHITSYCFFMDFLVNTPRDVEILNRFDVIEHMLGSDEEVAHIFNNLCKGITWDVKDSYLMELFEKVIKHTKKRWPKWRAKLVHDYFSNPWVITSLIAATFVIFLTSVQAYKAAFK